MEYDINFKAKYAVVYDDGNPENTCICCECESTVWAEVIAFAMNKRYYEKNPCSTIKSVYRVCTIDE